MRVSELILVPRLVVGGKPECIQRKYILKLKLARSLCEIGKVIEFVLLLPVWRCCPFSFCCNKQLLKYGEDEMHWWVVWAC